MKSGIRKKHGFQLWSSLWGSSSSPFYIPGLLPFPLSHTIFLPLTFTPSQTSSNPIFLIYSRLSYPSLNIENRSYLGKTFLKHYFPIWYIFQPTPLLSQRMRCPTSCPKLVGQSTSSATNQLCFPLYLNLFLCFGFYPLHMIQASPMWKNKPSLHPVYLLSSLSSVPCLLQPTFLTVVFAAH